MISRGLKKTTIKARSTLIQRFAIYTNEYPWTWTPEDLEAFSSHLRSGEPPVSTSTLRNYQNTIRLFHEYLIDPRYEWSAEVQERFNTGIQQIVHEWNSISHASTYEGEPTRRALTVDEVQTLFDAADDLITIASSKKVKGTLSALRTSAALKTTYAFGLRRLECSNLSLADFRHNPKVPEFGRFGGVFVRYGKSSRGGAHKRRTVLLTPEMDWIIPTLDRWIDEVRPSLGPVKHSALWLTERGNMLDTSGLERGWREVRAHADLPAELTLHGLRHSYVTHLLEFGYPELFVQKQVGHSYASTTSLYSHVGDEFRTTMIERNLERQMRNMHMEDEK
jgi:site-specific recombinase XerD